MSAKPTSLRRSPNSLPAVTPVSGTMRTMTPKPTNVLQPSTAKRSQMESATSVGAAQISCSVGKNSCSFCASLLISVTMRPALSSASAPLLSRSVLRYTAAISLLRNLRPVIDSMMRSWLAATLYTALAAAR